MEDFVINTPVLLIVFNRPHKAIQVFEKIRQVRPPKLFIVADGPRPNRPGEEELVRQCRALKDLVDWDCDLKINFAETNMGCRDRIASGITWAFEHVEELIILEDDCVPHVTFFRFCQELLEKYRNDTRIFSIGGFNHDRCEPFDESYAFSKIFIEWGWATWKRAWNHFDITVSKWPVFKQDRYFKNVFYKNDCINLKFDWNVELKDIFQLVYEGKVNSWAYVYVISSIFNHGLHIVPKVNLVRNTGFESGGVHIQTPVIWNIYMDEAMDFPLVHPDIILPLDRLLPPPTLSEKEHRHILSEYDSAFRQLFHSNQYRDVITLFKEVLHKRITPLLTPLTPYHLNYVYYVAIAYFNLGDYEHAEAMLDIVLSVDKKNINVLLFMTQIHIMQRNFTKVYSLVEELSKLDVTSFTKEQTALLDEMLDALNSIETK